MKKFVILIALLLAGCSGPLPLTIGDSSYVSMQYFGNCEYLITTVGRRFKVKLTAVAKGYVPSDCKENLEILQH